MPAIKKVFDLMGADIVETSTENEYLKNWNSLSNGEKNLKLNN